MPSNPTIRRIPRHLVERVLKDPGLVQVFLDMMYGVGETLPANTELAQDIADQALFRPQVVQQRRERNFADIVFQPYNIRYALSLKEDKINKDASNGYVGLSGFSINFKNALGTLTSFLANANTGTRTYTFQDRSLTVAGVDDIEGGTRNASFANCSSAGAYVAAGSPGMTGVVDTSTTPNLNIVGGLVISAS